MGKGGSGMALVEEMVVREKRERKEERGGEGSVYDEEKICL